MDNKLLIKFSWGTFCRRVIIDRDTQETSMIDILPSLKIQIPRSPDMIFPNVPLNLNKMAVVGLFTRCDDSDTQVNEVLDTELLMPGFDPQYISVPVDIKPEITASFVPIVLDPATMIVSTEPSPSNYTFQLNYKIGDQQLGKVILPVEIKFI